jgi:hypothetical protein
MKFKEIFEKYWFAIITGIASGLVVSGGLLIKNIWISAAIIFVFAVLMTLILSLFGMIDSKVKNARKTKQQSKRINWCCLILWFILIVICSYLLVLYLQWNFTLYHESGHLQACKAVNISCELNGKSFSEYLSFSNYNIFKLNQDSVDMNVTPKNMTQFCNLSEPQIQLIRIAGFRNDFKIILLFSGLMVIESLLFLWVFFFIPIKNKKLRLYLVIAFTFLIAMTSLILFHKIMQTQSYFSKNIGDLFYYPCRILLK